MMIDTTNQYCVFYFEGSKWQDLYSYMSHLNSSLTYTRLYKNHTIKPHNLLKKAPTPTLHSTWPGADQIPKPRLHLSSQHCDHIIFI